MKLYGYLTLLFLPAGAMFGSLLGFLTGLATNFTVGLALGFLGFALLSFGTPLILLIAGRHNRASV